MIKTVNRSANHLNYEQIIVYPLSAWTVILFVIFALKQFGKVADKIKTLFCGEKLYDYLFVVWLTPCQNLHFSRWLTFLRWAEMSTRYFLSPKTLSEHRVVYIRGPEG